MDRDIFRPGGLDLTKKAAEAAHLSRGSSVLDIGCGSGATLSFLNKTYGCRVCGIDLSENAVRIAKEKLPTADIRCENASELSFKNSLFDAVFMECTLTLFSDPASALSEAYRVLKPGGKLLISVITAPGPELISEGAADPERLICLLKETGFSQIVYTDEKPALTQLYAEIIFEYGSMEKYLKCAEKNLGGTVLHCNMKGRKGLSYGTFYCMKP